MKLSGTWRLLLSAVVLTMMTGCIVDHEHEHDHYRGGYDSGYGHGYGEHYWNYDHGDHVFHEGRP